MTQQINLINPAYRQEFKTFSSKTAVGGWFGMWIVLLLVHTLMGNITEPLESKKSSLAQKHAEATAAIAKLQEQAKNRKPSKALEDEIAKLEASLRLQREILLSLETGGLGSSEGFSKYLSAFARQRVEGVWLVSLAANSTDSQLALRGRAIKPELVPAYIKTLGREDVLRGHVFSELNAKSGGSGQGKSSDKNNKSDSSEPEKYIEFSLGASPTTGRAGAAQ